ncbi:ankyrin repeat-containing domain protein [Xylaria arbuscula]|nr:ankyrin repeat-containing domain protein [Xylaria arbuscula]
MYQERFRSPASHTQTYWGTQQEQHHQGHVERINPRRLAIGSSGHSLISSSVHTPQPEERDRTSYRSQPSWASCAPESHDSRETQQEQYHQGHFEHNATDSYAQNISYRDSPPRWSDIERSTAAYADRTPITDSYDDFDRGQFSGDMAYSPKPELKPEEIHDFQNTAVQPEAVAEATRAGRFDERQPRYHNRSYNPRLVLVEGHDSPSQVFREHTSLQHTRYNEPPTGGSIPINVDLYNEPLPSYGSKESLHSNAERSRSAKMMQKFEHMSQEPSDRNDSPALVQLPTPATPSQGQPDFNQQSVPSPGPSHHASIQQLRSAAAIRESEETKAQSSTRVDHPSPDLLPSDLVILPKSVDSDKRRHTAGSCNEGTADPSSHAPENATHPYTECITCDGCHKRIWGPVYHCLTCPDWNFCTECFENKFASHPGHKFKTIIPDENVPVDGGNVDSTESSTLDEQDVPTDRVKVDSTESGNLDHLAQAKCSKCKTSLASADFFYLCLSTPDERICQACQKTHSCGPCARLPHRRRFIWYGKRLESDIWINPKPDTHDSSLIKAIKSHDTDALDQLVQDKAPVTDVGAYGRTPLHVAAHLNLDVGAKLLIMHGADLDVADMFGRTPLCLAISSKHRDLAVTLFRSGANWRVVDTKGNNILHLACRAGCKELVELLVGYSKNGDKKNLFERLVGRSNYGDKKDLVDSFNAANQTPLFYSCRAGEFEIAALLLAAGADPNAAHGNKTTQLGQLAYQHDSEAVTFLLDHGAAVDSRDKHDCTVLYRAAQKGGFELCDTLIKRGADPNAAVRGGGRTILGTAAETAGPKTLEVLLRGGAALEGRDCGNCTALHRAVGWRNSEACLYLLKQGANPNPGLACPPSEEVRSIIPAFLSPLHMASCLGDLSTMQHLIQHGAHLETPDETKRTPLHYAASAGQLKACKKLIESGAVVEALAGSGGNVVSYAATTGHLDVVEYFLKTQKMSGFPPPCVARRKWKNLQFRCSEERSREILTLLRSYKHV